MDILTKKTAQQLEPALGWQRILSDGHMWVARLNRLTEDPVSYLPGSARKRLMFGAVLGVLAMGLGASAMLLAAGVSNINLSRSAPEAIKVADISGGLLQRIRAADGSQTAITKAILETRDDNGQPLVATVVRDYLAGKANANDFAVLPSFAATAAAGSPEFNAWWPAGKVGVVKTDKTTWFGFRFKVFEGAPRDSLAVVFTVNADAEKKVWFAMSDAGPLAGLPAYQMDMLPRELIRVGLAKDLAKGAEK